MIECDNYTNDNHKFEFIKYKPAIFKMINLFEKNENSFMVKIFSINTYFNSEIEHQTVGMLLSQFVKHFTPNRMFNQLNEPAGRTAFQIKNGIGFFRIKMFHYQIF